LDFMSWTTILQRGWATGDQAVIMMLIYSIVGFIVGFVFLLKQAYTNSSKITEFEPSYKEAMITKLKIDAEVPLEDPPDLKQLELNIQEYAIIYGKPGDGDVFTVVRYWHCIPMLGVLSFVKFYTKENHDGRVSRLLRASSLRTLILINSWSTIAITIPCVFVIVYIFVFGGVSFKDADMFTIFSAFQAILSIVLTFSAMGYPGFEDTVVSILKNADELSYERAQMQVVCKKLFTYWKEWHLDLAEVLVCFRNADIGKKTTVKIGKNKKSTIVVQFPDEEDILKHPVWKERFDVVWKEKLITICKKLIAKYALIQTGNIYQEEIISDNCEQIVKGYEAADEVLFWTNVKALYGKVSAFSPEAAREVYINKSVLGLSQDPLESNVSKQFKKIERDCLYQQPLNALNRAYKTRLEEFYESDDNEEN